MDEFESLLRRAGLSKAGLARLLGMSPGSAYRWKPVPSYVMAYLRLYVKVKEIL